MQGILPTTNIKGLLTLTIKDADTLEVKRIQSEENVITDFAIQRWMTGYALGSVSISGGNSTGAEYDRIYISNYKVEAYAAQNNVKTFYTKDDVQLSGPDWVDGSPDFVEMIRRFNQPVTTRTINTIYIGERDSNSTRAYTIASLNTPCVQETNEVLDITYRIQFFYQPSSGLFLPSSPDAGYYFARHFAIEDRSGFPEYGYRYWNKPPLNTVQYNKLEPKRVSDTNTRTVINSHYKTKFGMSFTESDNKGEIFGCMGYGYSPEFNWLPGYFTTVWSPVVPPSFANSPIQPIHNHNANAVEPFLDVSFLASSQGTISIDGSAWTDPDYPEFYRIEYSNTGDVGTGRYFFRKRNIIGFDGSTYQSAVDILPFKYKDLNGNDTLIGGHGLDDHEHVEEYDTRKAIMWDDSGITIQDQINGDARNFDALSTPALNVTSVGQVTVDNNKDVWVACRGTGLHKIVDPFGSPTIIHFDNATNGIPAAGDNACYAVAEGYNNSMWAVFNGGLSHTTNGGTTWTNYDAGTGTPFNYTGISDNNWATVRFMRVDKNNIDNQLAVMVDDTTGLAFNSSYRRAIWWSTVGVATQGPQWARVASSNIRCSKYGSAWVYGATSIRRVKWGTETDIDLDKFGVYATSGRILFFYDYYNTPITLGGGSISPRSCQAVTLEGKRIDDVHHLNNDSLYDPFYAAEENGGNGLFWRRDRGSSLRIPHGILSMSGELINDSLNIRYSPMEECVWEKYHWNGASWQKDYYAPALDTGTHSGGPYDAIRHNFDTEDQKFTGRSLIDVSAAFASSNFGSSANATFAFKLIPESKLSATVDVESAQEEDRTIFEISDSVRQFKLVWDENGNIGIVEDGSFITLTTTPVDGSTYRLVTIVNGTSVDVYLDGSQIGTTHTLSAAYDWQNLGSSLKMYIGARMYSWDYQLNSPWPNNFYRGIMENIQLWNVAWTPTDVSNDMGDINGVIVSQPAANLVARYQLTQSLFGLETKLTHGTADVLYNGLTISFANGASSPAAVTTDYYTFGVCEGILKDDAISFSQEFSLYHNPVDLNFQEFLNDGLTSTIPASASVVTDPIAWDETSGNRVNIISGQLADDGTQVSGFSNNHGAVSVQNSTGDCYIQFKIGSSGDDTIVGLTDSPSAIHNFNNINFGIEFKNTGIIDIRESGSVVSAGVATFVSGDEFKIERVGTTVTYYKIISGTPTSIYVSGTASSTTVHARATFDGKGNGIFDCIMNYTRPAYIMDVGNSSTLTGKHDIGYRRIETDTPETISMEINTIPVDVIVSDTYMGNMSSPGPGQVVINGQAGILIFNSADVGGTVTGQVTVIKSTF